MTPNEIYYSRAYVKTANGVIYGNVVPVTEYYFSLKVGEITYAADPNRFFTDTVDIYQLVIGGGTDTTVFVFSFSPRYMFKGIGEYKFQTKRTFDCSTRESIDEYITFQLHTYSIVGSSLPKKITNTWPVNDRTGLNCGLVSFSEVGSLKISKYANKIIQGTFSYIDPTSKAVISDGRFRFPIIISSFHKNALIYYITFA